MLFSLRLFTELEGAQRQHKQGVRGELCHLPGQLCLCLPQLDLPAAGNEGWEHSCPQQQNLSGFDFPRRSSTEKFLGFLRGPISPLG